MSYATLAQQLESLAQKLRKQEDALEGPVLAKAAATFSKSLSSFEKKVDALIKGKNPSIEAIQSILKSPAKKLLKVPAWQKLHREVFRTTPADQTAAQLQKSFLARAQEADKAEAACRAMEKMIQELSVPIQPVPKDKAALQAEFLRLGNMDEEAALIELSRRWSAAQIKNLAKHNAIPVPDKAKRDRLEREILHYARRAHTNISR